MSEPLDMKQAPSVNKSYDFRQTKRL